MKAVISVVDAKFFLEYSAENYKQENTHVKTLIVQREVFKWEPMPGEFVKDLFWWNNWVQPNRDLYQFLINI